MRLNQGPTLHVMSLRWKLVRDWDAEEDDAR